MKAGQQLVFGEQIGWIDPGVIDQKENAEFMRQIDQLRWHLRRYFYAGEMLRPPKLIGNIPDVKADWQWAGEWWVATPAVLTGAWKLPQDDKLVLIFVNVSDETVHAKIDFNPTEYGIVGKEVKITTKGTEEISVDLKKLDNELIFPSHTVCVYEMIKTE
jgi:hypothetical protein